MLDTVKLIIPKEHYKIIEPYNFNPPINNNGSGIKHIQNPSKNDYRMGIYKPRLTIIRRKTRNGVESPLIIEFSVPKLIFKNNIDELEEDDFEKIIKILKLLLLDMGIKVEKEILEKASISAIHFSKNIIFKNFNTISMILDAFSKIDVSKKYDFTKTNFKNNGHALTIYSKTNSIIIYDKIKDLLKTSSKSIDKDNTIYEKDLKERFNSWRKPLEILRIEVRLCNKKKVREILLKVGFVEEINFKNIFKKKLAKNIIKFYLKMFYEDKSFILNMIDLNPQEIFSELLKKNKSCKTSLSIVGAMTLIEEYGMNGLRKIIESKFSNKTWSRLKKDLEVLRMLKNGNTISYINHINSEIDNFESVIIKKLGI